MSTATSKAERIENLVQVVILVVVGAMAGAASFTHVHDWTMANSPEGTHDWFGWANAVISELTPIAAGLEARRRSRNHQPIGYPITILLASVALSLAAQFAVAKPGISGWLLSAVPALAFMALVKLVITRTPATVTVDTSTDHGDAMSTDTSWNPPTQRDHESAPATAVTTGAPVEKPADMATGLLMSANLLAAQHRNTTGKPITATVLAERLGVDHTTARRLLTGTDAGTDTPTPPARVNGHDPVGAV